MRPMNVIEVAALVSVTGAVLAASVPSFLKNLHASRLTEAVDGLSELGTSAIVYSQDRELAASFPPPAPLTPSVVPRGVAAEDPAGTWETPTWKALAFRFTHPHRYAFGFDVTPDPSRISFRAHAHGDLNGDGIVSTFELTGERRVGQSALVLPGMAVHQELE
ncbi:MAG: hypothetical protein MUF54_09040 [Polyangiaceae bacterium]|jgi:hypothetical protein|nr:hypothetical protein [Polyangiaceae bacterium]